MRFSKNKGVFINLLKNAARGAKIGASAAFSGDFFALRVYGHPLNTFDIPRAAAFADAFCGVFDVCAPVLHRARRCGGYGG